MKNYVAAPIALFFSIAILLSGTACSKKEQAGAPKPQPTPAQQQATEEVKKEVKAAKAVNAASVNGVEITMFDLVREMNRIAPHQAKQGNTSKDSTAALRKQALDNLVTRELVVQQAIKEGMKANPGQIDQAIGLLKEQMGEKEFQSYLNERAGTEKELRSKFERNQLFEMITAREVYGKIAIDEKEMRAEYEKNKNLIKDKTGKQLTYDAAADMVRRKLTADKGAEKLALWGRELRKNAQIALY